MGKIIDSAGRAALALGRGFDTTTGDALGVALEKEVPDVDTTNSGQIASFDINIVETSEELEESLGFSVKASGRYGFFSASAKFDLLERTQFKEVATYVVARAEVRNPPVSLFAPTPTQAATNMVNDPDEFRRAFGDSYVRSVLTGGEFFLVLELFHRNRTLERSIAASVKAEYNKIVASVGGNVKLSQELKSDISRAETRVLQYQAAGAGAQVSVVADVEQVLQRLVGFPQIARENPVSFQVEVAPYHTVPPLGGNLVAQTALREALDDCAQRRFRYRRVIDEVDFVLQGRNREFFVDPPSDHALQEARRTYTEALNAVHAHAIRLKEGSVPSSELMFVEPADLPILRLERASTKQGEAIVFVPDVVGQQIDDAKSRIRDAGLIPLPVGREIRRDANPKVPRLVVSKQSPPPQAEVASGSEVQLAYVFSRATVEELFGDSQLEKIKRAAQAGQ